MRAWVVALSLASGCDQALNLKHVPDIPPPPDAPMYCYGPTVDAAIGSDPDLDNRPSENDNCPDKMNADQADEDGDCLGDACDKCPWIATLDPSYGDSDLDGLADVCDPYEGGANTVYFEGFNDANEVALHFLPNNWSVQNGAWHPAASFDVAIQNLDSGSGTIYIGLRLPSTTLRGTEPFMVGAWVLHYIDGSGRDTGGRIGLARDTSPGGRPRFSASTRCSRASSQNSCA